MVYFFQKGTTYVSYLHELCNYSVEFVVFGEMFLHHAVLVLLDNLTALDRLPECGPHDEVWSGLFLHCHKPQE